MQEPSFYQQCCEQYHGPRSAASLADTLYAFTARVIPPDANAAANPVFVPPSDWQVQIQTLAASASAALDDDTQIYHPPGLASDQDPARRLRDPLGLAGLDAVTDTLVSQLEQSLYGCHVAVDKVHIFRQLPTTAAVKPTGSWVWHADGHPAEFIKVQVYLNDVDEDCSVFQLLWSEQRQRALRTVAYPMHSGNWLSGEAREGAVFDEAFIQHWQERAYGPRSVYGPAGTTIVFATNCVHRGTVGLRRKRDSLILRLRPTPTPQHPRLNPKATVGEYTVSQAFAR